MKVFISKRGGSSTLQWVVYTQEYMYEGTSWTSLWSERRSGGRDDDVYASLVFAYSRSTVCFDWQRACSANLCHIHPDALKKKYCTFLYINFSFCFLFFNNLSLKSMKFQSLVPFVSLFCVFPISREPSLLFSVLFYPGMISMQLKLPLDFIIIVLDLLNK